MRIKKRVRRRRFGRKRRFSVKFWSTWEVKN